MVITKSEADVLLSVASDLKRVALGFHCGSKSVATTLSINLLAQKIDKLTVGDSLAEDALMYSTLLKNRVLV